MKGTRYFEALRSRPDRAVIRDEWIERAIRSPVNSSIEGLSHENSLLRRYRYVAHRVQESARRRDARPGRNTVLDPDAQGNVCAITVEHASRRAGIPQFSYEQVAA
jgi:uncharacterized protein YuzE